MTPALEQVAKAAGLSTRWVDYRGCEHQVPADTLRRLLAALELPANSPEQLADSNERLNSEKKEGLPTLLIADCGTPLPLDLPGLHHSTARLVAEDGVIVDLALQTDGHHRFALPAIAQPGYYELLVGPYLIPLAVCPQRCHDIGDVAGDERIWGLAAQLYSLRRKGDGGIGDFAALATLASGAAAQGADAIAISPVHALFSNDPAHFSPYAPSSRLFLNALHAAPAMVFGDEAIDRAIGSLQLNELMHELEQAPLIDWPVAATAKLELLRALYTNWADRLEQGTDALANDYRHFVTDGGPGLRRHACFEVLHGHFLNRTPSHWHWRHWPAEYRHPESAAVARFAASHARDLGFHLFLQWLADRCLRQTQRQALDAGMRIGLIADLAVGADSGGSLAWSHQQDILDGLTIGAPADLLNGNGQNWGLTAFSPRALRQHAYRPFIDTLRASLRHTGGLRIDHVLGLRRLWLIPHGAPAGEGAYLEYPQHDLLRLIALESWRYRAIIIGEDLGTIPPGFREELARTGVLGIQVLWFERDHGYFIDPSRWSRHTIATTTTHDLPGVCGWWHQRDIDWRARLAHGDGHGDLDERRRRTQDRDSLWSAFLHAGVTGEASPDANDAQPAVDAALAFVARTPAPLAIAPMEDLLGLDEQPNIPGTHQEHPNWRRRLPSSVDSLLQDKTVQRRLALLRTERKR